MENTTISRVWTAGTSLVITISQLIAEVQEIKEGDIVEVTITKLKSQDQYKKIQENIQKIKKTQEEQK